MPILLIEDESKLAASIAKGLREAGYEVEVAKDGAAGLEHARGKHDLIIADIMLPKLEGWEIIRQLRSEGVRTPVIFLTARDSVADRVKGLELGADDYVVKPFAFVELLARVRSLLRRSPQPQPPQHQMRVEDLELDMRRQRATRSGAPLHLTPKEFVLLARLARSPGEVVSRSDILKHVWDIDFEPETNVVDVVVRRLRAKVDDPFERKLVQTIRGVGYALKTD